MAEQNPECEPRQADSWRARASDVRWLPRCLPQISLRVSQLPLTKMPIAHDPVNQALDGARKKSMQSEAEQCHRRHVPFATWVTGQLNHHPCRGRDRLGGR